MVLPRFQPSPGRTWEVTSGGGCKRCLFRFGDNAAHFHLTDYVHTYHPYYLSFLRRRLPDSASRRKQPHYARNGGFHHAAELRQTVR